ncbi:MAG: PSD1 domain-containing protein [Planctomycetes bacterium]|nr:PSD1 domain-containing protein [Planctomycetota bacterium]
MRLAIHHLLLVLLVVVTIIGIVTLALGRPASLNVDQDDVAVAGPSFNDSILPIFSSRCFKCHGPDGSAREAELRFDVPHVAFSELPSGHHAIVAGDASASELIRRVTSDDPKYRMPPPSEGDRLAASEIELLRKWIDSGAQWQTHWSFVAPKRHPLPIVSIESWQQHPIDRFIGAKLEEVNLTPAPQASRHTLIRRVSLDLTGLPPTPEQVQQFVNDKRPDAYEKLVDRLLDSPRFGERWASVWLDQARYADTKGYEKDAHRTIWPYRDWVIRAINDDMPFDQFTLEQIAGDLLEQPTQDQLVATAFHRNTMTNDEGGTDDEEFRVAAVMDRTNTTMQVWMGLTMGCATCHSHKFDPITQREYYEFYAFFDQTQDADRMDEAPTLSILSSEQLFKQEELQVQIVSALDELKAAAEMIDYQDPGDSGSPDPTAQLDEPRDFVWIDDRAPIGSIEHRSGGLKPWPWIDTEEQSALSGQRSAWLTASDFNQFFSTDALVPLVIGEGDRLFAHVFLDKDNPPREIMLQFYSNRDPWGHRAYWGENIIKLGQDATVERLRIGDLPASGAWHRLEVAASDVGLMPGDQVTGWAFTQHGGRVGWDKAGLTTRTPQDDTMLVSQAAWEARVLKASPKHLAKDIKEIVAIGSQQRTQAQHDKIHSYYLQHINVDSWRDFLLLSTKQQTITDEINAITKMAPTIPIMRQRGADKQRTTHVLTLGNFLNPTVKVEPGVPGLFHEMPVNSPMTRLGLAKWLVSRDNPLTARVTVNRIWSRIFGFGLVLTEEDFGTRGFPPSHPQLLDHLALDFMDSSWSLKAMCRLIVTSQTYQQLSITTQRKLQYDPENRLHSRGVRYRLSAEIIRDQALAVAGLLSDKMYGPSVYPPQPEGIWQIIYSDATWKTSEGEDRYRRALYTYWRRTSPYPSMITFDAPSREFCVIRRIRTNTPLQVLTTLNGPVYVEASQALARRIVTKGGADPSDKARFVLELCLCRPAKQSEIDRLVALYNSELAVYKERLDDAALLVNNSTELEQEALPKLAAWTVVANVVLNLDEFLNHN